MKKKTKDTLRKIRWRVLWEKWFFNRGKSIWSDIIELLTLTTIAGLFTDLLNKNFGTDISVATVMKFVPALFVLYWITGRIDFHKLHIIQVENEIGMIANPALYQKVIQTLKFIKQILTLIKKGKKIK